MAGDDRYEVGLGAYRFDPADMATAPELVAESRVVPLDDAVAGGLDARAMASEQPHAWIVQVSEPLTPAEAARLKATYGLRLTDPVPQLAFVERVDRATAGRLPDDVLVRAVVPFLAVYKIAPTLGRVATLPAEPAGTDHPEAADDTTADGQLVDVFPFPDADPEALRAQCLAAGAQTAAVLDDRELGGRVRIRVTIDDNAVCGHLADLRDIRWLEPVALITDDNVNAATTIQSGTAGMSPIWNKGLRGEGQIIGIMDGGPLDINHCFFLDSANNTPSASHRKVVGIRNATGTASQGHATFVAGCAAGDDMNNPGAAARRGGAFNAKLHSANRRDLSGTTLLAELNAAAGAGVFIHSNSWHAKPQGPGNPATYDQFSADVDTFTFTNEDHLVLGSSGNTGEEQGPPGTAKNSICVSAAQADPNEMNVGDGNSGPTADGRRKPDLVAVGCAIQSAMNGTACGVGSRSACATSYATPHAAAAAALVRQYFTTGWYPTGEQENDHRRTPTGALLKAVLLSSTVDMTGTPGYPSTAEGWGLIQLNRSLYFTGSARRLKVFDVRHADGLTTGSEATHRVDVEASDEELRVVLVYSDAPGSAGAVTPTVNNLNLEVTAPDGGSTFLGNRLVNGFSTTGGAADPLNNVEVVRVQSPANGTWRITVKAPSVTTGNPSGQGYAIAVTGKLAAPSCYVASAVYGDPFHPDVDTLRDWRDDGLAGPRPVRLAVRALNAAYHRLGPPAAARLERHPQVGGRLRQHLLAPLAEALRTHHRGTGA